MSPGSNGRMRDESGSAIVEFVLVGALLTVLTLGVLQLALALHIRNTLLDAASEGARFAALADNTPSDGVQRTKDLITTAIGPDYADDVTVARGNYRGHPSAVVTVITPLPLFGLFGIDRAMEVRGHAVMEAHPRPTH